MSNEELMSLREIAAHLGRDYSTVRHWLLDNPTFPEPALNPGPRRRRWTKASIDQWWMGSTSPRWKQVAGERRRAALQTRRKTSMANHPTGRHQGPPGAATGSWWDT